MTNSISGTINSEDINMKTINVCQLSKIKNRERQAAARQEQKETLQAVGMVVFFILILGVESWVDLIVR